MKKDLHKNLSLLKLDPDDEINYAFAKTLQNKFMSTHFMQDFEDKLYKKMLKRFNENSTNFEFSDFCLPIPMFDSKEINEQKFREMICKNDVPPFILKNFNKHSTAVKSWTLEYFASKYPQATVAYAIMHPDKTRDDGLFGNLGDIFLEIIPSCSRNPKSLILN